MRRKLVIMAVAALLLAALCMAEQMAVYGVTGRALAQTESILQAIRADALDEAQQKAHALDDAWDKEASRLEMMVNHAAPDDVRYALSRLLAALESGDAGTSMIYASELEGSLEQVRERQELLIQNIL